MKWLIDSLLVNVRVIVFVNVEICFLVWRYDVNFSFFSLYEMFLVLLRKGF